MYDKGSDEGARCTVWRGVSGGLSACYGVYGRAGLA